MKWISVKKSLPICNKQVFDENTLISKQDFMGTYFESDVVLIVVNSFEDNKLKNRYFSIGCVDNKGMWLMSEGDTMSYLSGNEKVSHWCKVPCLPKI